jgi:serine/threonine protein kinase
MINSIPSLKNEDFDTISLSKLKLIGQGRTAEVFLLKDNYVIKLFRPSFPLIAIENEYNVCKAIKGLINIPKVYQLIEIDGRNAIIYQRIVGSSGFKYLLSNPLAVKKIAYEFAEIQFHINSISIEENIPELTFILNRNMNMHDLLSVKSKLRIINFMNDLPKNNKLCHGDYHPDNLLFQKSEPFVIDWMTATKGNPLADVARTSILLKWAEPGPGTPSFLKILISYIRKQFYKYYISRYIELSGAKISEIEKWELPVLAARLMEWIPESEKRVLISEIDKRLNQL